MILDTSVLVDIDRGRAQEQASKLDETGPHMISAATAVEFHAGVYLRTQEGDMRAQRILNNAQEIPLEGQIAEIAGRLVARKHREGLGLDLNDIYIAATALVKGEPVLTSDTNDFSEIRELEVQDWEQF